MFTGINFDRALPLSGAAPQKSVSSGTQRIQKERLHYDLFELSQRPEGEEKAIRGRFPGKCAHAPRAGSSRSCRLRSAKERISRTPARLRPGCC